MPSTVNRVPTNTAARVNQQIRDEMAERVRFYSAHPKRIPRRLKQLDKEWEIERVIEANASLVALTGIGLGAATKDRRWLVLPALVTVFLFQHAIQGWCPPVPILRRLGFRTAHEIEQERHALKALRGDFRAVQRATGRPQAALKAVAA
jgi:hypothetical protein